VYCVAVKRDFIAQHYLIGGDWGAENELHSHHYQVELQLHGAELDRHGYLVDIVEIEEALEVLVARYRDQIINDLPEFEELNPSIEHFSRILCHALASHIRVQNITSLTVRLWENQIAWASYQMDIEPV
jgi:6-pyruvoyltetrahydropterin/6-carboxytetrahydropterin synthase